MKLSIVADELSDDPATAFELGREWGVDAFELRGVDIGRVPRLEPAYERRQRNAISDFGITATAVSPGLFKMSYSSEHPATGDVGLGVNWDPANSLCGGDQPYPGGYEALSGLIRNAHFKDARATPRAASSWPMARSTGPARSPPSSATAMPATSPWSPISHPRSGRSGRRWIACGA